MDTGSEHVEHPEHDTQRPVSWAMVIRTSLGLPDGATVVLSIAPAFVFGYALTKRGVLRAGVPCRRAATVAAATRSPSRSWWSSTTP
jgi:hypothetical protein